MNKKRNKNKIRDMVEHDLLALSTVMDVSESLRKFYKLKYAGLKKSNIKRKK